mmetsp:Transcript_67891/g.110106  ORF Transcript_67891/g.110106 Transcript_67891/m.110106 type:complete len:240 (-) Transcript_67891:1280-1999(-)
MCVCISSDYSSGSEDSSRTFSQLATVPPSKGKARKTGGDTRSRSKNDKRVRTQDVFESDGSSAYEDPRSTSSRALTMRDRKSATTASEAHISELNAPIYATKQSPPQDEGTGSDMKATSEGEVIESNFQISRLIHYQGGKTTQTKIFGNLYMFIIIQIQASESVLAVILALFSFCRVRIHTVEYQIPRVELGVLKVGGGNLLHRNVVLCIFKCQSICMWISSNNSSSRNFCKTTKSKNK